MQHGSFPMVQVLQYLELLSIEAFQSVSSICPAVDAAVRNAVCDIHISRARRKISRKAVADS
jgi:hypothetical protein